MRCPGQDTQFWDYSAVFDAPCPQCGKPVEFFKDDTTRKCRCGHRFVNPRMDFGCAAYCQYAEQCLGDLPPELVAQKEDLLKDRVAVAVKRHLKSDFKRIGRAARRARHAERICPAGHGNSAAVLMAAYLWELDSAPDGRIPAARAILDGLKAPEGLIEKVCAVIGGHRPDEIEAQSAADAALITDLEDRVKEEQINGDAIDRIIESELRSPNARAYARELFPSS
jgi:transposase